MSIVEFLGFTVLAIYCLALCYITFYCLGQFHLLWRYKRQSALPELDSLSDRLPVVTVQLPVFNELCVVERLIDNICGLDYPRELLEIQVLDDSTDQTLELSRKKVEHYRARGFDITLMHRTDRTGYKAGALQDGLRAARGEFIAIFDADFLPKPDFLCQTLPHFGDANVGVVQTKWEHLNQDYSLITRLQAFQLNVHFTIEQSGRQAGDYLLQFNGTAGIWRVGTIEDAGGWHADTLTEDLDLSYRAQLKGWTIKYLENIGSPAELPAEMNGLKSQQFRWMKGGAETARKMLPAIWRSSLPLNKKLHSTLHLLSSSIFVFVFLVGVFSVPLLFLIGPLGLNKDLLAIFLIGLLTIICVYYVANVQVSWSDQPRFRSIIKFTLLFPLFLSLSMGLSLHNTVAVIQGYLGRKSAFIRTPKFNLTNLGGRFSKGDYLADRVPITTILEGLLALYFGLAFGAALYFTDNTFIIFHLLLAFGYGAICFYSIRHLRVNH